MRSAGHIREEGIVEDTGAGPANLGEDEEREAPQPLPGDNGREQQIKADAESHEANEKLAFSLPFVIGQRAENRGETARG